MNVCATNPKNPESIIKNLDKQCEKKGTIKKIKKPSPVCMYFNIYTDDSTNVQIVFQFDIRQRVDTEIQVLIRC